MCRNVKPTISHLKKLDDRSKYMVYFGVEEGSKAHRMFDPINKRIVVSRDVIFEESVQWKWNGNSDEIESVESSVEDEAHVGNTRVSVGSAGGGSVQSEGDLESGGELPVASAGSNAIAENNADIVPNKLRESHASDVLEGGSAPSSAGQPSVGEQSASTPTTLNWTGDSETPPLHYKNLNDVYDDTSEIKLELDLEREALLAETYKPTCYADAA